MRATIALIMLMLVFAPAAMAEGESLPPWLRMTPSSDSALAQLGRAVFHCLRVEAVEAQSEMINDAPEDLALMAECLAPIAQADPIEERQGCPSIGLIVSFYYSDLLREVPGSNAMGVFVSVEDWATLQRTNTPIRVCAWSRAHPRAPLAAGLPDYLTGRRKDMMREALADFMTRWHKQNPAPAP